MGFTYAQGLILVLTATMFAVGVANKNWYIGSNNTNWGPKNATNHLNYTNGPKKIIVGGSQHWRFGFNYTDWALKNGPFYLNDALVFMYDPPSNTTFPHSVYLLPNQRSFLNCDLRRARKIAKVAQGGGKGFEFKLKTWQPYYFACGEGNNAFHCKNGTMKFSVTPLFPPRHY